MNLTVQSNRNFGRIFIWGLVILIWLVLAASPFLFHDVRSQQVAAGYVCLSCLLPAMIC